MLETLRHKLRYWLSMEYRRETHAIGEIKKTFAGLPRCQATVVVANPDYGEGEYQATITMRAKDLLAWVNARLESGSPLYTDKVFLPLLRNWLKDARAQLHIGDVAELLKQSDGNWDAILLDVDNELPPVIATISQPSDAERRRSGLAHLIYGVTPVSEVPEQLTFAGE